jgi:hypothetical protein
VKTPWRSFSARGVTLAPSLQLNNAYEGLAWGEKREWEVEASRRPQAANHTRATDRVPAHELPPAVGWPHGATAVEEDQSRNRTRIGTRGIGGPEAQALMPNSCYAYLENKTPDETALESTARCS